ncbi:MAG: KUP/HAK/KT family potassium transporter [Bacteroidota bacterium]
MKTSLSRHKHKLSAAGLLITLGIVYGDIGTSPLYVMKAILAGANGIPDVNFILGAISCIIWTLTLQTTVKYVLITIRADNNGEGGIFALYALIRKKRRWLYLFAIIGGSALLADGIITPSITVISAVEGLRLHSPDIAVLPIAIIIIVLLFTIQRFGTSFLGKSFGPIMFIWFLMLGILGLQYIVQFPVILKAFNPYYAYKLLVFYPHGFVLLGAVFLCTTGAEALYSDLGHCGLGNIRMTWIFVKAVLVLNYLGQGAWILMNISKLNEMTNPFFMVMPPWLLTTGIVISTLAAVIASQALISGSYTIISEAIQLNFWPKIRISYPTNLKGQMYIGSVNWSLMVACIFVILFFKESSNMEAAYGLAITITMLMTSFLLTFFLFRIKVKRIYIFLFYAIYILIEGSFLVANLHKFQYGGWVTLLIAGVIFFIMFVWYRAREIKKGFTRFEKICHYTKVLTALSNDTSIPKFATNLVYLTRADKNTEIESKVMYSIIYKQPKRADMYWFLHIHVVDHPHTLDYHVEKIIPGVLTRVEFRIGFKVNPRINLYFRQVLEELVRNGEMNPISKYESLRAHDIPADFRFVIINRIQNYDFDFRSFNQFIMDSYSLIKNIGISDVRAYGLDTSSVLVEKVPLNVAIGHDERLKRIL